MADAADLAIGSVRHYFSTHDDLMRGAADEVIARITKRLQAHRDRLDDAGDRLEIATEMLCELLPLHANTFREVAVWLEIVTAGRTNPVLRESADRLFSGSRALAELVIASLQVRPPDVAALEAERLAALIDGLALRGTLHPSGIPASTAKEIVRRHLRQLRQSPHAN
ncbi:TetR/AcrR family transcriptional regulator [Rhodococcus sp. G-MC3]|uniref:TetR/AcrR family transcriptional regulator n=1 Tax=Rhodococcus sp. G-MC3 TaxID=3046209 RepID=UPI0030157925